MGVAVASIGLAGLLLAGCTSATNSASTGSHDGAAVAATSAAASAPAEGSAGVDKGVDGDGSAASSAPAPAGAGDAGGSAGSGSGDIAIVDDRQIIRTASVTLQVTVPPGKDDDATTAALNAAASAAATKVRTLAPGTGGYVSASDGGGSTISVTLRIPAASYDAVMNGLARIGEVTGRTEKTDDVTDEMVDVASRMATMKASVDRIRALLAKADKIGDVIAIESELTQREADLEALENRQTALRSQVALSTVAVTITAVTPVTVAAAPQERGSGFLTGLAAGWRALVSFGTWLGSVIGALLPFLPVIAVAAGVIVWITRRRRRTEPAPPNVVTGGPATPSATVGTE
jgi:hypothetical protein